MKKRIAVDIDDVVYPFVDGAVAYVTKQSGFPVFAHEMYVPTVSSISESGLSDSEFIRHVREYQDTDEHLLLSPVNGVEKALVVLQDKYDIVFVTSREPMQEPLTRKWFERHLQHILPNIQIICIGNHYTNSVVSTKAQVCKDLDAVWLVDDQPKYMEQLKGSGTKPVLFGDYPWNKDYRSDHIVRAIDWDEVLMHLL